MSEKKILVPEGMLKAASGQGFQTSRILEAALRWLVENPIVPTDEKIRVLWNDVSKTTRGSYKDGLIEWQRRMFLALEPEIPEAVKDLIEYPNTFPRPKSMYRMWGDDEIESRILEAYRRGTISQNEK